MIRLNIEDYLHNNQKSASIYRSGLINMIEFFYRKLQSIMSLGDPESTETVLVPLVERSIDSDTNTTIVAVSNQALQSACELNIDWVTVSNPINDKHLLNVKTDDILDSIIYHKESTIAAIALLESAQAGADVDFVDLAQINARVINLGGSITSQGAVDTLGALSTDMTWSDAVSAVASDSLGSNTLEVDSENYSNFPTINWDNYSSSGLIATALVDAITSVGTAVAAVLSVAFNSFSDLLGGLVRAIDTLIGVNTNPALSTYDNKLIYNYKAYNVPFLSVKLDQHEISSLLVDELRKSEMDSDATAQSAAYAASYLWDEDLKALSFFSRRTDGTTCENLAQYWLYMMHERYGDQPACILSDNLVLLFSFGEEGYVQFQAYPALEAVTVHLNEDGSYSNTYKERAQLVPGVSANNQYAFAYVDSTLHAIANGLAKRGCIPLSLINSKKTNYSSLTSYISHEVLPYVIRNSDQLADWNNDSISKESVYVASSIMMKDVSLVSAVSAIGRSLILGFLYLINDQAFDRNLETGKDYKEFLESAEVMHSYFITDMSDSSIIADWFINQLGARYYLQDISTQASDGDEFFLADSYADPSLPSLITSSVGSTFKIDLYDNKSIVLRYRMLLTAIIFVTTIVACKVIRRQRRRRAMIKANAAQAKYNNSLNTYSTNPSDANFRMCLQDYNAAIKLSKKAGLLGGISTIALLNPAMALMRPIAAISDGTNNIDTTVGIIGSGVAANTETSNSILSALTTGTIGTSIDSISNDVLDVKSSMSDLSNNLVSLQSPVDYISKTVKDLESNDRQIALLISGSDDIL